MHADTYLAEGGRTGVLMLHGFTGSPASVLPWAEFLARSGYSVIAPRLPGHGTDWPEMNKTTWQDWYAEAEKGLQALAEQTDLLFIAGFSMGGALGVRLAERYPELISGLILVNPALKDPHGLIRRASALRFFRKTLKPSASDISKPNPPVHGYAETPLKALHSLSLLLRDISPRMAKIETPILLFRSLQDHVVPASSSEAILHEAKSLEKNLVLLENSFHVATLDYDAEIIHQESLAFIKRGEAKHSQNGVASTGDPT
ncbi:MAG TPA: alpha/beta fold hydrolase [Candidatus Nanopelagicaceae bacterium]|nr:alpha/beta fold hydrolase [Candidatus Nanopelagicaceae bacterium]